MSRRLTRLTAALLAVLVTPAAAYASNGMTVADLAVRADDTVWRDAIVHLNATNATSVPGYNISAPYSKYPQRTPDWELAISVTADIPTTEPAGKFFTGTAINWTPALELRRNGTVRGDKSWTVCMGVYKGAKLRTDKVQVDSTCDGILPDKCVKELQQQASGNSVCSRTASLPSECVDEMGKGDIQGYSVDASFGPETNRSSVGFYYSSEKEGHDKGNTTAYDDAIRQVWVVMTGFASNTTDSRRNSPRQETDAQGSLRCIRAQKFKDGSRSYDSAASGRQLGFASWATAVLVPTCIAILL
ncbi:hypothetical protein JDV02_004000 [Purpureocillium takamizusanense]|uniref:Uncharacterized protein n=1 Tax=Purpureocillium takamizusanense TaxID=2060973 RepID=A0A9Q8VAA7_9HYPO|nr:uncharacterized protein JDV02_004000 [Purpureocillium takamizusanense]UNI17674.1 hypothetical protein JDV02_004000 [Purpureocillium takamizusanense]